jgi:site-specific DNA-cytosine methylase
VRVGERRFDAAQALAEAIRNVSAQGLTYKVASQILVASEHLVPQVRERYLMTGVRADVDAALEGLVAPGWCTTLPVHSPIPLEVALEGLADPTPARDGKREGQSNGAVRVLRARGSGDSSEPSARLRAWISSGDVLYTDSHTARRPRADDAALFELMGPGKRWMDYRCDESPTLGQLASLVSKVHQAMQRTPSLSQKLDLSTQDVRRLQELVDGSLSLRLLLESIPPLPGETQHHLLAANYLKKKEGQHGDWLARTDPSRPSKTMVSHMGKDTYAYIHPTRPRTLSVREAARIQTFPDSYKFRSVGLVDAFRMIGNAVPPLLSAQFAERIAQVLWAAASEEEAAQALPVQPRAHLTRKVSSGKCVDLSG